MSLLLLFFAMQGHPQALAATPVDSTEIRIDELRRAGDYAAALSAARELAEALEAADSVRTWKIEDARQQRETLTVLVGLPDSVRAAYAETEDDQRIEVLLGAGQVAEAVALARQGLETRARILGEAHVEVALAWRNLASALYSMDLSAAREASGEATRRLENAVGRAHPSFAVARIDQGVILNDDEQSEAAVEAVREGIGILLREWEPDDPVLAGPLNSAAQVLGLTGHSEEAEGYLSQARRILARPGGDPVLRMAVANNLAASAMQQGNTVDTQRYLAEAYENGVKDLGPGNAYVQAILANVLAVSESPPPDVIEMLEKGLRDAHAGPASLHELEAYQTLGKTHASSGRYEKAARLLRTGIQRSVEYYGREDHPQVLEAKNDLAWTILNLNLFEEALALHLEVLKVYDERYSRLDLQREISIRGAGGCYRFLHDYEQADHFLSDAAELFEERRGMSLDWELRERYFATPYAELAATRIAAGRDEDAWEAAERDRGLVLADLLMDATERGLPDHEQARQDSLRLALSRADERLSATESLALDDPDRQEALRSLRSLEQEWRSFRAQVNEEYPRAQGLSRSLADAQIALKTETAMIGWLEAPGEDPRAWVLRHDRLVWEPTLEVQRGEGAEAPGAMDSLRTKLSRPPGRFAGHEQLWAKAVYRNRFACLEPHLEGVTRLLVVPTGSLAGVPVETWMDRKGRRLVDRFAISYVPSASSYVWLVGTAQQTSEQALLVGDARYQAENAGEPGSRGLCVARSIPVAEAEAVRRGDASALGHLPNLPETRQEVETIQELVRGSRLLVGADATEVQLAGLLEQGTLKDFGIIHFAVHGLSDEVRPGNSALLVPAGGEGAGVDGRITAQEVLSTWDLNADLVTLSACQTGLGQKTRSGYLGLSHAFLEAGARSVLVSLWPVDDCATALLMENFYRRYLGTGAERRLSKAEALQAAQFSVREFVDSSGRTPYAPPYFWAGFVLVGDAGAPSWAEPD